MDSALIRWHVSTGGGWSCSNNQKPRLHIMRLLPGSYSVPSPSTFAPPCLVILGFLPCLRCLPELSDLPAPAENPWPRGKAEVR